MYQRVKDYIQRYHMLDENDKVIVGVSGGADSVCLLFMLIELKKEVGCSLVAVHVHHGIREETADADAAYVERLCKEQGIELQVFREDVKAYARQNRLTLEEAGRDVRRMIFGKVLKESEGTKIALAHHRNDNAETLIWNLCRGCGLKGMGGIAPVDGVFIRPLLCLKRKEIESYLENRGISYCTDETNLEDDYTRNRIRSHVIPYLEEQVNSQTVLHMSETMEQMRMLGEYIEQESARYANACIRYGIGTEGVVLVEEEFRKVPSALQPYVLHEMICHVAGRRKDIELSHTRMLTDLLNRQVGRRMYLPYGIEAVRCYEGIELSKNSISGQNIQPALAECEASMRVFARTPDMTIFPETPYTKWFDYDIIRNTVKIRHRVPGDYITIDRHGGTQKLKQYFINEKIPYKERDRIWLVADGQHIMWIVGYRQNQKYQVTDKTRRILEIKINGGKRDGRER
ncbi:tRNA lysidine(34) synthetase TilS [Bariatricus sp. SGI.154]|uniref:tRNA lysidine(34) synthetase TilS n=1 Tax=Bariatricus sp. SGI.154 TaxID=3420549 RepID=UPI003CFBC978